VTPGLESGYVIRIEPVVRFPVKQKQSSGNLCVELRVQRVLQLPDRQSKIILNTLVATLILMLPVEVWALRCGSHLISKGDTQAKVLKYCGEPMQTKEWLGLRHGSYVNRRAGLRVNGNEHYLNGRSYLSYGRSEVVVEDWVLNFGPHKLMRRIRFENGFVEKVETLGYGFRE